MAKLVFRTTLSLAGVAALTIVGKRVLPVNATTVAFAYLLFVLVVASAWGFVQSAVASIAATICFNFFFLPPFGTFSIEDPENWIAFLSFGATALVASRLSAKAEARAQEANARREDVEHLYSFSRAILLIEGGEDFPKQLVQTLAQAFDLQAAVLYDRRSDEVFRGGPADFDGLDHQLREAARQGGFYSDTQGTRVITAVRLGSEPIAAIGLQGARMPDSVLQGIANLVAIGLERAKAQDLAHQVEAARRSEQLRTTLLDAMAHEFKTPLTSIRAATTALLSDSQQPPAARTELLSIADEEAERLRILIDDAIEMARLDTDHIDLDKEPVRMADVVREVLEGTGVAAQDRQVVMKCGDDVPMPSVDRRLVRLALKQVLDNAFKYSRPDTPVEIRVRGVEGAVEVAVTDRGAGIPAHEQQRVFDRFYRGPATKDGVPGSGLGLSIAKTVARAHGGTLTLASKPGETTFVLWLPANAEGK